MASSPTTQNILNATGNATGNVSCRNDYCVSDEEYIDMIEKYLFPDVFEWILISIYALVFIMGLAGNFLVCFAVLRNPHMRTVTNHFIVNLAVADFLVLLICLPPTVLGDVVQTWFMGAIPCKIVKYLQGVSVVVSILTLTVISIERWYAICYPLSFKSTTTRARITIVVVWVIAMLIYIPDIVVLDTHRHNKFPVDLETLLLTTCKPTWSYQSQAVYQLVLIVALFVVPFCLMGYTYFEIAICLWYIPNEVSNQPLSSEGRSNFNHQLQSRRKAAKMLIAVVVMFGVCYLPVHLLNILRYAKVNLGGEKANYFALIAHWLCYFNSSINPVIYNFMGEKFRKAFRESLACGKSEKNVSIAKPTFV